MKEVCELSREYKMERIAKESKTRSLRVDEREPIPLIYAINMRRKKVQRKEYWKNRDIT